MELGELVDRGHTALVTVELQDGVVGDNSVVPVVAKAADKILPNIASLCRAARAAKVPVIHCTVDGRDDGFGGNHNTRLMAVMRERMKSSGSTAFRRATVNAAVGVEDSDLVLGRLHGLSPMQSSSLDPVLRNLGVTTIVGVGVSANVAVLGFSFEAVNLGYHLVLPRDGVAGVPDEYVDTLFKNTYRLLATITTCAAVEAAWSP